MNQGWTMNDIDEMDIHWYFEVMSSLDEKPKQKEVYIDQIF
jgi:hypothetical protein